MPILGGVVGVGGGRGGSCLGGGWLVCGFLVFGFPRVGSLVLPCVLGHVDNSVGILVDWSWITCG